VLISYLEANSGASTVWKVYVVEGSKNAHWIGLHLSFHLTWVLGPSVHGKLQNLQTSEVTFAHVITPLILPRVWQSCRVSYFFTSYGLARSSTRGSVSSLEVGAQSKLGYSLREERGESLTTVEWSWPCSVVGTCIILPWWYELNLEAHTRKTPHRQLDSNMQMLDCQSGLWPTELFWPSCWSLMNCNMQSHKYSATFFYILIQTMCEKSEILLKLLNAMSWPKVSSLVFRFWSLRWINEPNNQLKWKLRYRALSNVHT